MPLLTCNFCVSTFNCVMWHLRKLLAQVTSDFQMCHELQKQYISHYASGIT